MLYITLSEIKSYVSKTARNTTLYIVAVSPFYFMLLPIS
jgi:hypothetical protein